jgi:hypothetical protein
MAGSRHALIIANDQYDEPGLSRLVAPTHDAGALAEALRDQAVGGFEVQVLTNESAHEVRLAVEDFFADRAPHDTLLLHFSGHGLKNMSGELFLAVADTLPKRLASTAVSADFLSRQMADSRAERIVLFLDCCYGGAFPRGMVVRADAEVQVLDAFAGQSDLDDAKGRAVVTASSAIEYAFEGDTLAPDSSSSPSVFTGAVVDALTSGEADADGDGWVGLHELFDYVSSKVRRTNPHQTPHMWSFGAAQGELLIARSRIRRIKPMPLSDELTEAMSSPLAATRFGLVDLFRQALVGDDLARALTAKQALGRLLDDDSRRVSEAASAALEEAQMRWTPEVLTVDVTEGDIGTAELTVDGPPLARVVSVTSSHEWLQVAYVEPTVQVTARPPRPGVHDLSLTLQSPTGQATVPVQVTLPEAVAVESTPLRHAVVEAQPTPLQGQPGPEPSPEPEPAPIAPPEPLEGVLRPEAVPWATVTERPMGTASRPIPPWLGSGLLVAGAVLLAFVNRPGDGTLYAWKDVANGWQVLRSGHDPYVVSSTIAIVAGLVSLAANTRLRCAAVGTVLGCSSYFVVDGVSILLLGFAYEDGVAKWVISVVVGAAMSAVALVLLRPRLSPVRFPGWLPIVLLVAGLAVSIANELMTNPADGRRPVDISGAFAFALTLLIAVLACGAISAHHVETREPMAAATCSVLLAVLVGTFGWDVVDQLGPRMALRLPSTLLILAALAVGVWSRPRHDIYGRAVANADG